MDGLLTEANELLAIFAASQRTARPNDSMRNDQCLNSSLAMHFNEKMIQ